jgi:hypothetical protein
MRRRDVDGGHVAEAGTLQQLYEPRRGEELAADVGLEELHPAHHPPRHGSAVVLALGERELRHEEHAADVEGGVRPLHRLLDVPGLVQGDVDDGQIMAAVECRRLMQKSS